MAITFNTDIIVSRFSAPSMTSAPNARAEGAFVGPVPEDNRFNVALHYAGETAFEGLVVGTERHDNVRIMSDVWASWTDVIVARPKAEGGFDFVRFRANDSEGRPEVRSFSVDATGAPAAAWKAREDARRREEERRAAEIRASKLRRANADARLDVADDFEKGDRVVVVKGRKVPVGTEGVIFWEGSGNYGRRVGFKDAEGTVHWTARSNVERADLDALAVRFDGNWIEARAFVENARINAAEAKRRAGIAKARETGIARGVRVKTACGKVGKVFWLADDGSRAGVRVGKAREDVVWANVPTLAVA